MTTDCSASRNKMWTSKVVVVLIIYSQLSKIFCIRLTRKYRIFRMFLICPYCHSGSKHKVYSALNYLPIRGMAIDIQEIYFFFFPVGSERSFSLPVRLIPEERVSCTCWVQCRFRTCPNKGVGEGKNALHRGYIIPYPLTLLTTEFLLHQMYINRLYHPVKRRRRDLRLWRIGKRRVGGKILHIVLDYI